MAQPAAYQNPMKNPPFWQKASAEPLERSKWAVMMEMAVLAKDGIEVHNLNTTNPPVNDPTETILKLELTGETVAEKREKMCNQEKKVTWENNIAKVRKRGALGNNFPWVEAHAREELYFLVFRSGGPMSVTRKTPGTRYTNHNHKKSVANTLRHFFYDKNYRIRKI